MSNRKTNSGRCGCGVTRRSFLADTGLGFTGLALGAMLFEDGIARADGPRPDGKPHFPPKAKSVIWLFFCGGVSHVESFDPETELNKYNGKPIDATPGDGCGGEWTHGGAYLGPEHAGVRLNVGAQEPLPFVQPGAGMTREEQIAEFGLLGKLNRLSGIDYPDDPNLRARIKAYELAYGMQKAVPETLQLDKEAEATRKLYGTDQDATRPFGQLCLSARRLVERGVR